MDTDPALKSKDRSPASSGPHQRRLYVKRTAKVLTALVVINCNLAVGFTAPANAAPVTTSSAPSPLSLSTPSVMKLLAGDGVVTVANELTTRTARARRQASGAAVHPGAGGQPGRRGRRRRRHHRGGSRRHRPGRQRRPALQLPAGCVGQHGDLQGCGHGARHHGPATTGAKLPTWCSRLSPCRFSPQTWWPRSAARRQRTSAATTGPLTRRLGQAPAQTAMDLFSLPVHNGHQFHPGDPGQVVRGPETGPAQR